MLNRIIFASPQDRDFRRKIRLQPDFGTITIVQILSHCHKCSSRRGVRASRESRASMAAGHTIRLKEKSTIFAALCQNENQGEHLPQESPSPRNRATMQDSILYIGKLQAGRQRPTDICHPEGLTKLSGSYLTRLAKPCGIAGCGLRVPKQCLLTWDSEH